MNTKNENQYLLLFRGGKQMEIASAQELQEIMERSRVWFEGLAAKGIVQGSHPLKSEAKLVSGKGGRTVVDGPFTESKEAIGGYLLLTASSFEEATAIAQAMPGLDYGSQIEVREIADECPLMTRARKLASEPALATA